MCHYHVKAVFWKLIFLVNSWDRYLFNLIMAASEMSKISWDLFETAGTRGKLGSLLPASFPHLPHEARDTWAQVRPICLFTSGIHFCMGLFKVYSCPGVKPHLSTNGQFCFRQGEAPPAIWSEAPSSPGLSASDLTTFIEKAPRSSLLTPSLLHFPCR